MNPNTYRTIMRDHTLAKLYVALMEEKLRDYMENLNLRELEQISFIRAFSTIYHIFTLRCLIDQAKARKKKLYSCFVDFRKAFDIVPRERLFDRLKSLEIPNAMIWAIYALYEQVSGCVRCLGDLYNCFISTIGVKYVCPLSSTLFGIYIDEIIDFIARKGHNGPWGYAS